MKKRKKKRKRLINLSFGFFPSKSVEIDEKIRSILSKISIDSKRYKPRIQVIKKGKAFTLLELFICLSIMAVVMGYFGVKINEGITTKRFDTACLSLEEKIHFCQRMAISHEMDMLLCLENKKEGIHFLMGSSLEKGFFSKQQPDESIFQHVHFLFDDDIKDRVIIGFSSTGIIFPLGKLTIQSKKLIKEISLHDLNHIQTGVKEIGKEPLHPFELEKSS